MMEIKDYTFYEERSETPLGNLSTDDYGEASDEAIRLANLHGVIVQVNCGDEELEDFKPDGYPSYGEF